MSTERFIQERKYLKAVTPKTLAWYRNSFRAFEGALESAAAINARIVELRERGVKPVSINTWLRCIKGLLPLARKTMGSRTPKGRAAYRQRAGASINSG